MSILASSIIVENPQNTKSSINEAAYYGLAGETVRLMAQHAEAAPEALLAGLLTLTGNVMGSALRMPTGGSWQHTNLFTLVVGPTASRKSDAYQFSSSLLSLVEPDWRDHHVLSGISSGEGLIQSLLSANPDGSDPSAFDARLLVHLPEFARFLAIIRRAGETLDAVSRDAFDGSPLSVPSRANPIAAPKSHISILGNITPRELSEKTKPSDWQSGLLNRFLIIENRRAQNLPFGGEWWRVVEKLANEIWRPAMRRAKELGRMEFSADAKAIWSAFYENFAQEEARSAMPQARNDTIALRLAMIYAALDGLEEIQPDHLYAALAIVEYSQTCLENLTKKTAGGPTMNDQANRIYAYLADHREAPVSRSDFSSLVFSNHIPASELSQAIQELLTSGLIQTVPVVVKPGGRAIHKFRVAEKGGE